MNITATQSVRLALQELLVAVTYSAPPKEYGTEDDPNLCYEARVPVEFVDAARSALSRDIDEHENAAQQESETSQ